MVAKEPINDMDVEDWTQCAEAMYSKAIPAGSLTILTKLVEEINGDSKVESDLGKLKYFENSPIIKVPVTGSDSVNITSLLKRMVQNDMSRSLVPRNSDSIFSGATLAQLRASLRVAGTFSISEDRTELEALLKDAPGVIPSLEVFGALSSLVTWADATRSGTNAFYDIGFEFVDEMSELALLRKQLEA